MAEPRFKTYTELAQAFKDGTLDRKRYVLVMDNDCCYLQDTEVDEDAGAGDELAEGSAYDWFDGNGECDILKICEAAGIPAEGC